MTNDQLSEEAFLLQQMMDTRGWKVVEDEAKQRTARLTESLIWSDDADTIRDLQANIRSLDFLLRFPVQMQEAAKRANAEAQDSPDASANESAPTV